MGGRRARVEEIARAAAAVRERLAAELLPGGFWRGELSESALTTATGVAALALVDPARGAERIARGLSWLAERANPDGGWGDTVRSRSNPSTTALAWSAFAAAGKIGAAGPLASRFERAVRGAEAWLSRVAGSLAPSAIAETLAARYGRDRTFSAPILALAAASGRLGEGAEAWRHVLPLPFELAAFPRRWFAALRLPVVSYAIPALVAIGLARSENLPARNPLLRAARRLAAPRALRVLAEIQPSSGGFLEATPLTSFVAIGLAAAGRRDHPA
ncbi:MAG: prenyltransferase/squalene oxidase repeat-containing protein, partial [Planctomycetota bacterium]